MRKALWILTAPVVAGGLAWAVNAADEQGPLLARAPSAQAGKIYYFSRSGKAGTEPKGTAEAEPATDEAESTDLAEGGTLRYRRTRTGSGAAAKGTKNYYKDLFGEAQASAREASSRKSGAATASAKAPLEECGVNEACDESESSREENLLPASRESIELTSAADEGGEVQHADHRDHDSTARRRVEQIQHTARPAAKKIRAPRAEAPVAPPAAEEEAMTAPPPPATKTAKAAPARSARVNQAIKAAQARAATRNTATTAQAPKARNVRKVEPAATPAEHVPVAPSSATIQQVSGISAESTESSDVPMIALKWVKRGDVNVGQECKCGLVVRNTGKLAAKDIVVEAYFPRTVRLLDAEPFPSDSKDHLTWVFDHMEAGTEKTIEITMIPGRRGELATSATVRFTGVASTVLKVEEPQLSVAIAGPREVMVGESTTQIITVSNPGTGIAHDVVVHASLPEGLEHPRGKSVELGIGSLGAGESREIRLPLAAVAGGDSTLAIEVRGANLVQKAQAEIKVAAPKLSVDVAGPGLRYINRHAQYTITVKNDGIAATDNVRIVHLIPEGFAFVNADRGGKYDSSSASVSWFIGRLEAGQTMQVTCDLNARDSGEYQHHVQASGENGTIAAARIDTKVDGASAIVMEVADLDDPIEIETQTAYEIKIRNDGSKSAQNLRLACELPQGVELIDTEGPTDYVVEKGILHFRPLAELAAGSKITYRIKVNGKVAGNLRLRAKLTSNASTEPLIVEELTRFYAD